MNYLHKRWQVVYRWVDTRGPSAGVSAGLYRRTPRSRPHGAWLRIGRYYYGAQRIPD